MATVIESRDTRHDLKLTRVFDAPRALVFKAMTEASHVAAWWGPHGFSNPHVAIQPWPGGRFEVDMQGPDGTVQPMGGRFVSLDEPAGFVFRTSLATADGKLLVELEHTVALEELGPRTRLALHTRVLHVAPSMLSDLGGMGEGWSQSLERL
ncbi:SRPBCC domain-containing protein, partial [Spirulina sp. 06S082]|uniref:SRPBCC family protein n=1 Tax=Spirulina sp. 06S082 TaxID=3110248 RepID=UPI002B1FA059